MSSRIQPPALIQAEAALLGPADFEGVDAVLLGGVITDRESRSLGRMVQFAWGYIYGDRKGRFGAGEMVRTSYFTEPAVDDVYTTRNSTYRIRLRAETPDDADA